MTQNSLRWCHYPTYIVCASLGRKWWALGGKVGLTRCYPLSIPGQRERLQREPVAMNPIAHTDPSASQNSESPKSFSFKLCWCMLFLAIPEWWALPTSCCTFPDCFTSVFHKACDHFSTEVILWPLSQFELTFGKNIAVCASDGREGRTAKCWSPWGGQSPSSFPVVRPSWVPLITLLQLRSQGLHALPSHRASAESSI